MQCFSSRSCTDAARDQMLSGRKVEILPFQGVTYPSLSEFDYSHHRLMLHHSVLHFHNSTKNAHFLMKQRSPVSCTYSQSVGKFSRGSGEIWLRNSKLKITKIGLPLSVTPVIRELLHKKWTKSPEILTEGSN